jgi:broad specificity phosphatase PhoE
MTTLYFVRHGDVHNPDQILYARLPGFRLSTLGETQAAAAGTYFKDRPLAAIYSSPQHRAQQTAGAIAQYHPALTIQTLELLDEIHSPFEGRPLADLDAMGWRLYTNLPAGYETAEDIMTRVVATIQQMRAAYPGQEVVCVSHGDVVLAARYWAKGIPFNDNTKNREALYPATASITALSFPDSDSLAKPVMTYTVPYEVD